MREIKFRAWDLNENTMRYSDGREGYTSGSLSSFFQYTDNNAVELMQYTGLKDKNGKEIYEGDIVNLKYIITTYDYDEMKMIDTKDSIDKSGVIIFLQGAFMIDKMQDYPFHIDTPKGESQRLEVIGNIYENPELLKEYLE